MSLSHSVSQSPSQRARSWSPQIQLMSSWYQQIYTKFLYTEAVSADLWVDGFVQTCTQRWIWWACPAWNGNPFCNTASVVFCYGSRLHFPTLTYQNNEISNLLCLLLNISGNLYGQYTGLERQYWSIKENQDRDVFGHVATNKMRLEI